MNHTHFDFAQRQSLEGHQMLGQIVLYGTKTIPLIITNTIPLPTSTSTKTISIYL